VATGGSADQPESGAEFRQKFEDALAKNAKLESATRVLAAKAFGLQPDDFQGVEVDQYDEHAAKVHQDRENLFQEMAKAKGLDVSALSQADAQAKAQDATQLRLASVGELRGTPPAPRAPTEGLTGQAALEAYYASQES
jgi:hypothetical protein